LEGVEYKAQSRRRDQEEVFDRRSTGQTLVFPTSTVQRQFWLLHQLAPDSAAYNIAYAFRITGHLDGSALQKGLEGIVSRHAVFRTTFATQGDRLVQVVSNSLSIEVPFIDLTSLEAEEADATVGDMIHATTVQPFDLSEGPLVRALLLRCSREEHAFVLVIHHIITDLQALNYFFRELTMLYEAHLVGAPCPLEKPSHHYSDYALWEQRWLESDQVSSMLSYWEEELRGQEALLALPTDRPRPAVQSRKGAEIALELSASLTADLKQFSRRAAIPLFVTLLSAYVVLLHRLSRQASITVGVPFTNRRQSDFRDVMGCFVNILPIHVELSGNLSFLDVARRVRQTMLAAHRCQEVTLELIVERLKLERNLSHNPLYQVGLTYCPPIDFQLQGVTVTPLDAHLSSSQLDMFASLWESEKQIFGRIEFCMDLFDRTTVQRFAKHYETLLRSVVEDADQPIATMPMFPEAERVRLLSDQNVAETPDVAASDVHTVSEKRTPQTPDSLAGQKVHDEEA